MTRRTSHLIAIAVLAWACDSEEEPDRAGWIEGDPEAGARVIARLECGVCHVIPGVRGARGVVGPPLTGFARRTMIGGVAPNRASVLVQWLRDAPSIAPDTGMPALPLSEEEARHAAAFLYTLR